MIEAFTGPSDLDPEQRWHVMQVLAETEWPRVWRTGCAYGVDTLVAYFARAMEFDVDLELYVPHANHNGTLVRELAVHAAVHRIIKHNGDTSAQYRKRNRAMMLGVEGDSPATSLTAFVKSKKFYRSGEWMTINIARNHGIPVNLEVLPA